MLQISARNIEYARRSKIREEQQQQLGFETMGKCLLVKEGRMGERGISGGPWGPHTSAGRAPCAGRACTWCACLVGPLGTSQVPLCPILCVKFLYNFSGIFRETFFVGYFSNFINDSSTGKYFQMMENQTQN